MNNAQALPVRAVWAERYIGTFGFALVVVEPGEKGPKGRGWNKPGGYITDAAEASRIWGAQPNHNIGVVLGPSRVCSLDVDDVEWTRYVLREELGVDLDAMADSAPTVVGNPARFRVMFRVPDGTDLSRHSLSWPNQNDPDGSLFRAAMDRAKQAAAAGDAVGEAAALAEADALKKFTVFELRGGAVQDLLPPSIHPGTGKPYVWRTAPSPDGLPELPADLIAIWKNWDVFKRHAEAACPWAPSSPAPVQPQPRAAATTAQRDQPSVIDQFNQAHDVESLLAAHGYERKGRKWLCPHSSTGLPGISINEGKMFSHHGSDPLANGRWNDPFAVFNILEHKGDDRAAVKAAARALGLDTPTRPAVPPARDYPDADLPHTPSAEEYAEPSAAATDAEGAGGGWTEERLLVRFALIVGGVKVFDLHRKMMISKNGFEVLVGKPLAKSWFANPDKKLVNADLAKRMAEEVKLGRRARKVDQGGMGMFERYVYLDGTKEIYDAQLRERLPAQAVQLALGDVFKIWVNSEDRRVIPAANLIFDPRMTESPADTINTFEGLPLTPRADLDLCSGIRWLIKFLCNDQADAAHWLTCWLAYPLQQLGAKLHTAVLMHSTMEGSGKSFLFDDIMRPIYGDYGATVGQTQLESGWSAWQSNKLYGLFEEVVSRDQRYNQVGKIKHMVTGKTKRIESKFMSGWEETNYMNAVFLSNEILPWPIGENDRRMLVVWPEKTMPDLMQKRIQWETQNGGIQAFYQYLLDYETGDFDQRTRPPHTPARQRLVDLSRAGWDTFYQYWKAGLLDVPFELCRTQDLYDLFVEWCSKTREHAVSQPKFVSFLSTKPDTFKTDSLICWTDDHKFRRKSMFFVPRVPEGVSLSEARSVGEQVRRWRIAALDAGWNPDKWAHCIGFNAPLAGTRRGDSAEVA